MKLGPKAIRQNQFWNGARKNGYLVSTLGAGVLWPETVLSAAEAVLFMFLTAFSAKKQHFIADISVNLFEKRGYSCAGALDSVRETSVISCVLVWKQ